MFNLKAGLEYFWLRTLICKNTYSADLRILKQFFLCTIGGEKKGTTYLEESFSY